jgi:hypothetical protein
MSKGRKAKSLARPRTNTMRTIKRHRSLKPNIGSLVVGGGPNYVDCARFDGAKPGTRSWPDRRPVPLLAAWRRTCWHSRRQRCHLRLAAVRSPAWPCFETRHGFLRVRPSRLEVEGSLAGQRGSGPRHITSRCTRCRRGGCVHGRRRNERRYIYP